jgi:hypothetical protein
MLSRISDAVRLLGLRLDEWLGELSPGGRRVLIAAMIAVLILAAHYGLLPSKHRYYNPHAVFNW